MFLIEKIEGDLKSALKASDKVSTSTIRLIKSSIKNKEIEKGGNLEEDEVISILSTLSKQHKESIEHFSKAGRIDLVNAEKAELEVIKRYLPEELSEEDLEKIIAEAVKETNAKEPRDIGMVMKAVMPRVKGRADGKTVNTMVARLLSK